MINSLIDCKGCLYLSYLSARYDQYISEQVTFFTSTSEFAEEIGIFTQEDYIRFEQLI